MQSNKRIFEALNGRLITVRGVRYKWVCGESMVKCSCEHGHTFLASASSIKGISPADWELGKQKRTSDGALTPKEVAAWIEQQESMRSLSQAPQGVTDRIRKNEDRRKSGLPLFG